MAVTMRTPGPTPSWPSGSSIRKAHRLPGGGRHRGAGRTWGEAGACNVVEVALSRPFDGSALKRNFFATSSCGVCGKATLEQVAVALSVGRAGPVIGRSVLIGLPEALRGAQTVFDRTGGLHAAGLFDVDGRLIVLREDVGRHNAVDKLVGGASWTGRLPLSGRILLVSGRTSFEILQKAAVAGVPIVCAVSAPSTLAVSVAERLGITLVGFLRGSSFNVYTHADRIDPLR